MIGSGSGAPTRSAPAAGRLRRSTATTAKGTTSTRKSRARAGRRGPRDARVQGRAIAADGRFSTGTSAGAESTRGDVRWTAVAVARCPRPMSRRLLPKPRATRPSDWAAALPATIVAIGSARCTRHATQVASPVATRVSLKTCDAGSTSSTSTVSVAGAGSAAAAGATSTSVSIAAGGLASAAGAGAPGSFVTPGVAAGSSSAGIPAVGSSSYDGLGAGDSTGDTGSCATGAGTPRSGAVGTAAIGCATGGAEGAA